MSLKRTKTRHCVRVPVVGHLLMVMFSALLELVQWIIWCCWVSLEHDSVVSQQPVCQFQIRFLFLCFTVRDDTAEQIQTRQTTSTSCYHLLSHELIKSHHLCQHCQDSKDHLMWEQCNRSYSEFVQSHGRYRARKMWRTEPRKSICRLNRHQMVCVVYQLGGKEKLFNRAWLHQE